MNKKTMEMLRKHTIWIMEAWPTGYAAYNCKGEIIATSQFKSSLVFAVQVMAAERKDIWAVAPVVRPENRQPNRALPNRKRR